jgi:hypothetical protein
MASAHWRQLDNSATRCLDGPGLLSPTRRTRDVGAAATSGDLCELDLVQHAIRSWRRAQTLDPNQRPENCPWIPKPDP